MHRRPPPNPRERLLRVRVRVRARVRRSISIYAVRVRACACARAGTRNRHAQKGGREGEINDRQATSTAERKHARGCRSPAAAREAEASTREHACFSALSREQPKIPKTARARARNPGA